MRSNTAPLRYILLAIGLVSLPASPGRGAVIVSDGFESYTLGDINGQSGGTNGTGTWTAGYVANTNIDVVSGGLSYSNGLVVVNGGSQSLTIGNISGDNVLNRSFTAQTGNPIYFSFLFSPVAGLTPGSAPVGDFLQFLLNDDADLNNAGSIGLNRSSTANPFFARMRDNSTDTNTNTTAVASEGLTFLLVGKLSKVSTNYNRIDLWVNPTSPIEASNIIAATATRDSLSSALSFFTLRTADLDSGDDYRIDELVIGESFADVTGVPEPGTLSLLALGALFLLGRRRG